jgi:tetratricopeptide (TPR) repeat protein
MKMSLLKFSILLLLVPFTISTSNDSNKELSILKNRLESRIMELGESHEETQATADRLANLLLNMNKLEESLDLYRKQLSTKTKQFGESNLLTSECKGYIALILSKQGKKQEALKIYREVRDWAKKILIAPPTYHRSTTNSAIVAVYFEKWGKEMLKLENNLNDETLETKILLAVSTYILGDKEKGLEIMEEVLEGKQKIFDEGSQWTREKIKDWRWQALPAFYKQGYEQIIWVKGKLLDFVGIFFESGDFLRVYFDIALDYGRVYLKFLQNLIYP